MSYPQAYVNPLTLRYVMATGESTSQTTGQEGDVVVMFTDILAQTNHYQLKSEFLDGRYAVCTTIPYSIL